MTDKQIIIDGLACVNCPEAKRCQEQQAKKEYAINQVLQDIPTEYANVIARLKQIIPSVTRCDYILEKQYKRKEQECEALKDKLNCCFCNPHVELNDTEKLLKCLEVTECFRRQLDQLKKENEDLKKQLESTKGLITVGNRQLVEALKENEELNKVNDEKNELLAKLGCPTIATAKRKVLFLQQQIDKLKEDNEELRKNVLLKCPNCGEEYLSSEGAALYEENANLKKRLKEVENESNI